MVLELLDEAVNTGCRREKACETLGVSLRTVQRWRRVGVDDRRCGTRAVPRNRLSDEKRAEAIELLNAPAFRDKSPNQIVPLLADQGGYVASESTLYRILREEKQLKHRQRSVPPVRYEKTERMADGPNRIWSWDIAWLRTPVRGLFFYLYLIVDLYSRKIIAWSVHEEECALLASELAGEACYREGILPGEVILHADNGAPMKGSTMLEKLHDLGVMPSFSRPAVSDDNPFSEALFRTLKYRPEYPERAFETLAAARAWMEDFVAWYNDEHCHSALKFVTPSARHEGHDIAILANRDEVYRQAKERQPNRWSGKTRNWTPAAAVRLPAYRPTEIRSKRKQLKQVA